MNKTLCKYLLHVILIFSCYKICYPNMYNSEFPMIDDNIINFKIHSHIFSYEKYSSLNNNLIDYDWFLISKEYPLNNILNIISNEPKSDFFEFSKFWLANDNSYLIMSDDQFIKPLRLLAINPFYINELRKNNDKLNKIKLRIDKISDNDEYIQLYKRAFKLQLEIV